MQSFKKQSEFTKEDIAERLVGFTKLEDNNLSKLKLSMLIRYFAKDKSSGRMKFRMGGILTSIDDAGRYIMLKNPTNNRGWSVQIKNATIYYKDNHQARKETHSVGDKIIKLLDKYDPEGSTENKINLVEDFINVLGNEPKIVDKNIERLYEDFDGSVTVLLKKYDKMKEKLKK